MDGGNGQEGRVAGCTTLPARKQAAVCLLKPGPGPLVLETWHVDLEGWAPCFLDLPGPFRNLCPDASPAELPSEVFGIIPPIGGYGFRTLPGGPRVPVSRRTASNSDMT
jgi:hypothetical protein